MDNKKRHCLVTGGSGFVGKALVLLLLKNGWKVSIFDSIKPEFEGNFDFICGDVKKYDDCIAATKSVDCVFHVAAVVPLEKNSREIHEVNVNGTANLLKSSKINKVQKFVFVSSSAVYGCPKDLPVTHETTAHPIEPYGRSKFVAENLCLSNIDPDFIVHIVRPRTVLGPGRLGIFGTFYEWIEKYGLIFIIGNLNPRYQFVHIDDLCHGIMNIASLNDSTIVNLGNLEFGYLEDEFRSLSKIAGKEIKIKHLPNRITRQLVLLACHVKILPFAPYQIKMFGKSFYFDSLSDWKKVNYLPRYSNYDCLVEGYKYFVKIDRNLNIADSSSIHSKAIESKILRIISKIMKGILSDK